MSLHSKASVTDYLYCHSQFLHSCLIQCETLYKEELGFSCMMILFNCLENTSRSALNDYSSKLFDIFSFLHQYGRITKKEYDFLNTGDFCLRKIRNLYSHKNISAINFISHDECQEILWPLTENETSLMLYARISDIVFNLIIKIVSFNFIDSVKDKFQQPLDEYIDACHLQYKFFTSKELLLIKGYPEDYIPDDLDIPEDAKLRLVDNAPDLNMSMFVLSKVARTLCERNHEDTCSNQKSNRTNSQAD